MGVVLFLSVLERVHVVEYVVLLEQGFDYALDLFQSLVPRQTGLYLQQQLQPVNGPYLELLQRDLPLRRYVIKGQLVLVYPLVQLLLFLSGGGSDNDCGGITSVLRKVPPHRDPLLRLPKHLVVCRYWRCWVSFSA